MKENKTKKLKEKIYESIYKNPTLHSSLHTSEKAITLIALVVTIIVILILATVTITGAINGGLFKQAGNAKNRAEIDNEKEIIQVASTLAISEDRNGKLKQANLQEELNKSIGEGETEVIEENEDLIVKFKNSNRYYEVDKNGNAKQIIVELPEGIKVGDYVNYTPAEGIYEISDEITGLVGVASATGKQTFTTQTGDEALKWRVWSIDKERGKVELIAATSTTATIILSGPDGYNHGVDIINDMCKALYSNGKAVARSINIEDINSKTTYDPTKDDKFPNYGTQPSTRISGNHPSLYDVELGSTEDMLEENDNTRNLLRVSQGVRQPNGKADYTTYTGTKTKENFKPTYTWYSYDPESYLNKELKENTAEKGLIKTKESYWLASRSVSYDSLTASFYVRFYSSYYSLIHGSYLMYSNGRNTTDCGVRPIVSLSISTTWSKSETEIDSTQTWDINL